MSIVDTRTEEIEHAGETFEIEIRNDKWYCPYDGCKSSCTSGRGVKQHITKGHSNHSRETRICNWCNDEYSVRPYKETSYCSMECSEKGLHDDDSIETADNRTFCKSCGKVVKSRDDEYCSHCAIIYDE